MKQTLAILLALVALAAFGQEATVKSVVADPLNISASKYPMTDLNGHTAALVIVRVLADNVEFKGSVLNGGVVRKTGEYWVYMGSGAKMLHIHSDKFLPVEIHFPSYDIPRLESSATYIVTLALPQAAAQPQSAAAGYNYLVLNVSPATAQVTIDGKPAAVQGGVAKRLLRSGASYSYRVEAQGYMPEEGTVAIGAERVDRNVALRSTKGKLSVATTTPGTEIYVNGDRVGAGSWSGELLPDNYLVEGRLAGHRATDMMVSVATGETRAVTLPALAAVTASLNVDYTPAGASVAIDGTTRGTTPNVFDGLLVGPHTVTISAPGYQPATLTATITESSLTSLEGSLGKAAAPAPAHTNNTSSALPFSLCAQAPDGSIVYFTVDDWKALPSAEQARYKKKGVVLAGNGEKFLVELEDAEGGKGMEWKKALKYNLPTKEQGPVMADNKAALNNALRAFGGTVMDSWYWTKTEDSSALAWYVGMYYGSVHTSNKTDTGRVRAVAPVPVASAI